MVVLVGGVLHAVVPDAVRGGITAQPLWLQTVEAFALAEVLQYWAHRASHTVPVLWRFHKLHHSITELDWVAAARLSPRRPGVRALLHRDPAVRARLHPRRFGALLIVFTLQALFIHANVRFTFGPLRYVFATPEFHHWHHAADPRAYNSNFAGELPVIDKLFGDTPPRAQERRGPLARALRDRRPGPGRLPPPDGLALPAFSLHAGGLWPLGSRSRRLRRRAARAPARWRQDRSGVARLSDRAGWSGGRSGRACPEGAGPVLGPTNEVRAAPCSTSPLVLTSVRKSLFDQKNAVMVTRVPDPDQGGRPPAPPAAISNTRP